MGVNMAEINKKDTKQQIEINRKTIDELLTTSANSVLRMNVLNRMRHELSDEAQILFQYPDYMPAAKKRLYLDYNSMSNLNDAWEYILRHKHTTIDNYQIRHIHELLAKNTDIQGGVYRISDAYIEQLNMHVPPYAILVQRLGDIEYNISNKSVPTLTRAFDAHYDIFINQLFNDFNKRTARLIMNWILIQGGYTPVVFNKKTDKANYMNALRSRANGDNEAYSSYMHECLARTQKEIITMIKNARAI